MACTSPDDTDLNCLFVANLPQRMTNEELAVSLLAIFKPFGPVISVKASRDQKGRPFGFVEYSTAEAAASALSFGPCLTLDSRRIRVEPAKRQRKLCIKYRLAEEETFEGALGGMRKSLQELALDEDFKLSLQSGTDAEHEFFGGNNNTDNGDLATNGHSSKNGMNEQLIAAVVKFEDPIKAREAYEIWKERHPQWSLTWINMDRAAFGSNVRNSGLVQLVPNGDGSIMIPTTIWPTIAGTRFASSSSPPPALHQSLQLIYENTPLSPPSPPSPVTTTSQIIPYPSPRYTPIYEEEHYSPKAIPDFTHSFEQLSLYPELLDGWLGKTLFVGRLNGQSVTLHLLNEHFKSYGPITFIRLYNRGVVGYDGVPIDAYAFIKYQDDQSVEAAITSEHGKAWLCQAIKCEHARPTALSIMLGEGIVNKSHTIAANPHAMGMMTVYYPNYVSVKEPSLFVKSPNGTTSPNINSSNGNNSNDNWFRASKSKVN